MIFKLLKIHVNYLNIFFNLYLNEYTYIVYFLIALNNLNPFKEVFTDMIFLGKSPDIKIDRENFLEGELSNKCTSKQIN